MTSPINPLYLNALLAMSSEELLEWLHNSIDATKTTVAEAEQCLARVGELDPNYNFGLEILEGRFEVLALVMKELKERTNAITP